MKRRQVEKKFDWKFVVGALAGIVLATILTIVFQPKTPSTNYDVKDLPEEADVNYAKLVISEILTSNAGVSANENNEVVDYIEIYNGTGTSINLNGYGLSDKSDSIKWKFPDCYIENGQYLVVYLTGRNEEGLNASFRLSSSGNENVVFTNASGKVIDGVTTSYMKKNQAMVRDDNGNWYITDYPTPGFENSQKGYDEFLNTLLDDDSQSPIMINEVLFRNNGNFKNEEGLYVGYIELKNISNEDVNLKEYSLSNDQKIPFRYQFADIILKPNQLYFLYTGESNNNREKYLGFSFAKSTGNIYLSHNGKIVENLQYNNVNDGIGYIVSSDGTIIYGTSLSLGYQNNVEGISQFQNQYQVMPNGLVINEVMNDNRSYLAQNGGRYYDWIELYNNSDETINLKDYYLTVDEKYLLSYNLPDKQLAPYGYYIIMCSGDVSLTNQSYYHANFNIDETEAVYLTKGNEIVDSIFISNIPVNYSYGRKENSGFTYMEKPTPLAKNASGIDEVSSKPVILTTSGVYNNIDSIKIEIKGEGTIYYTTDGSSPTTNSKVYNGPVELKKTAVIKAMAVRKGCLNSQTVTSSYIINENNGLPVMSISLSPANFTFLNTHRYSQIQQPAVCEFFEENGSFITNCSLTPFGGNALRNSKMCFALRFNKRVGADNLKYPLFDNRDNSVYDSLVLRTGSNDWDKAIFRDVLASSLVDEYLDVQAFKPCILYINGNYWGIYNIREKVTDHFIADHYNVPADLANIIHISGAVHFGKNTASSVINWISSHDLSNEANYKYACSIVDVDYLIDYWIAEMYVANKDVLNIKYWSHPDVDGGKLKYVYYDLDFGFKQYGVNYYSQFLLNPNGMTGFIDNTYNNALPRKFFANKEFKEKWLTRLSYHLQNTYAKDRVNEKIDELVELYSHDIERDRKRWYGMENVLEEVTKTDEFGNQVTVMETVQRMNGCTMANYNNHLKIIRNFVENRTDTILKHTKSAFNLSDEKMKEYFGDLW